MIEKYNEKYKLTKDYYTGRYRINVNAILAGKFLRPTYLNRSD